jgi:signal transduction histidine kinase
VDSVFPSLQELKEMMRLASSKATWLVFAVPIFLLAVIGGVADRTASAFVESEHWVSHTHEVETVIESMRADLFIAQESRPAQLLAKSNDNEKSGNAIKDNDGNGQGRYAAAVQQLPKLEAELVRLTADNPSQQARLAELEPVLQRELAILQESHDLPVLDLPSHVLPSHVLPNHVLPNHEQVTHGQDKEQESDRLTDQMTKILGSMESEENRLLAQRVVISADSYRRMRIVLAVAFVAVMLFLLITFGRLLIELRNRIRAEAAVRRLSGRILQLQDMERRKVARELHDGVAQYFASSKMAVDCVLHEESLSEAQRKALSEAVELLEQGIAEARTLSYLLHPPLLDEIGFRPAAEWYIKGFSERSKINVRFVAPASLEAMNKDIELVLFRVLQEALTNIHRHAASATAEVRLYCSSGRVSMEVEDRGKGISRPLLDEFQRSTGTGVGLAGMRERVGEFQGRLEITSEGRGTLLRVEIPLPLLESADATAAGPPNVQTQYELDPQEASGSGKAMMLASVPL